MASRWIEATRGTPGFHRRSPGVFYGWYIVASSFFLSFVSVGIGFYGQAIFLDALIRIREWRPEEVSGASTLYFITVGVAGLLVGRAVDRWGPRWPMIAGAFVMAGALVWLARVRHPLELYAVYLVLAVGFAMTSNMPLATLLSRWFIARRAFAMSLSQTGVSLGGVVLVPTVTLLIISRGFELTVDLLAVLVLAIFLPLTLWVIRSSPADVGTGPDGNRDYAPSALDQHLWRMTDAIRTRAFAAMALGFSLMLFCQVGVTVHLLYLLREHLSAGIASAGVSAVALGSITGRLTVGRFADAVDKRRIAQCLFVIQALAYVALSQSERAPFLLGASFCFGLTIGAIYMLQSLIIVDLFGIASFGAVYGASNLITSIGSGFGPLVVGVLASWSGGYPRALLMLTGVAITGALLLSGVPASVKGKAAAEAAA
jgi:MFS family permease